MPYCLYLRKSRADVEAENHGETDTLARHRRALLDLASRLSLEITEIYEEVVSGDTIAARPVMQRLLEDVEDGRWDGVLVMEVERLARGDTIDQGIVARAFEYTGTKIYTPTKVYDPANEFDREYFEFGLFMSRREYKTINRRMQAGRRASVAQGQFLGSVPPYGYEKCVADKKHTLQPDDHEAEIVRLIFEWFTIGVPGEGGSRQRIGTARIRTRLNQMGVPSRSGRGWVPATIRDILRNRIYIGEVGWKSRPQKKVIKNGEVQITRPRSAEAEWFPGLHPPLVSKETFDLAQYYLVQNPSRPGPKQVSCANPLSGLIVCGVCGRKMVRRPHNLRGYPDTIMCNQTSCHNISSFLSDVESSLLSSLQSFLDEYDLSQEASYDDATQRSAVEKTLAAAGQTVEEKQKQLTRAYELVEQEIYTADTFLERSRALSAAISEAKAAQDSAKEELARLDRARKARSEIAPRIRSVLDAYPLATTAEEKNDLLKSVVEKAVYLKTQRNHHARKEQHGFTLDVKPILPPATDD